MSTEPIVSKALPQAVVIAGPTAVGKTALAIELALRIGGEIINADSMQVYCGMDIGTAKPTSDERAKVPFHLLDLVEPDEPFTAAQWTENAAAAIDDIRSRHRVPVLCGGTGFYIRALIRGWSMAQTPRDVSVRRQLELEAVELGSVALHARLSELDPETGERLHPNDTMRVIRALEVTITSGVPLSEHHRLDRLRQDYANPGVTAAQFVLDMERTSLYRRIDERVDSMISLNFEAEVRHLLGAGYHQDLSPMRSLGYKEMCNYIHGEYSLTTAVDLIKTNTRRYAKRQLTWFRAEPEAIWINMSNFDLDQVVTMIADRLQAA